MRNSLSWTRRVTCPAMTRGPLGPARRSARGRPEVTTHAEIEQAAFMLFAQRGYAQTTLEAIAAEVGIGRRTLFRYF